MKDNSPEHHTHMLMCRMVLNNVIVPPAPEKAMNADVEKVVERFELLAVDHEPDGWPAVRMRDLTLAAKALRDQEAEIERMRNISDGNAELYQHEALRSEKADALLRECAGNLFVRGDGGRVLGENTSLTDRITAHLGGEHE